MSRLRRTAPLIIAALAIAAAAWGVSRRGHAGTPRVASSAGAPDIPARARSSKARRGSLRGTEPAAASVPDTSTTAPAPAPVARSYAARSVRRAAAVRETAAPRSVNVLRVPVPSGMHPDRRVDWTMRSGSRAEVLSATSGAIPANASDEDRGITVVTRIPAGATAGPLLVGEAAFLQDSSEVIVPVELEIARIRRASLTNTRAVTQGISGQRIALSVEVRNLGNSTDTVRVAADLPAGWGGTSGRRVVLIPGERQTVALETRLPVLTGSTMAYPVLRAKFDDSTAATLTVPVHIEDRATQRASFGPQLIASATSTFGDSITLPPVFEFALSGPVAQHVSVFGHANLPADHRVDRQALGRAGTYLGSAFVTLRGPNWFGTLGNGSSSLSPLSGIGASGQGITGGITRGAFSTTAFAWDVPNGTGAQAGARGEYRTGGASVGAAATHLQSAGPAKRQLDAFSLLGSLTPFSHVHAGAEIALRSYDGGSGIGVASNITRTTANDLLGLQVSHSPGGSQAFGTALNSWNAVGARRFGDRATLSGSTFRALDESAANADQFQSSGWQILPRFALTRELTVEVETRHSTSDSRTAATRLTSGETNSSLGLRSESEHTTWSIFGTLVSASRGTGLATGPLATFRATGYGLGASALHSYPRVTLASSLDYSRTGQGVGQAPQQLRVSVGATRIALRPSLNSPILSASASWTSWFGDQPSVLIARVGAEVPIGRTMSLVLDAERNPLLRAATHPTPWILAVRLQRGFTLGWLSRSPSTRGYVYDDRNANGIRDADEEGLGGVMVRRGDQSAITDRSGRFTLPGTDRIALEVDPASLPSGMVAPSQLPTPGQRSTELGVVPTGAVAIHLVRTADELGRLPQVDLGLLAVVARDEHGAEWYLRADSSGVVHYDALPPARYTFVADFSGTSERLRQIGDPVVLDLRPGENLPPLEIRFTVRQVRLFNGGQSQTDQRRRR